MSPKDTRLPAVASNDGTCVATPGAPGQTVSGDEAAGRAAERLRLAHRLARVAVREWCDATDRVTWGEGMEVLWGMAPGSFRGTRAELRTRIHPADRAAWEANVRACVEAGQEHRLRFRVLDDTGRIRWLAALGNAERDAAGQALRLAGVVRDITEEHQVHEELECFFNLPLHLVCIMTLDLELRRVNPAWAEVLGYRAEHLRGRHLFDLTHPEDIPASRAILSTLTAGTAICRFEQRCRHRDGSWRNFDWSATALPEVGLIYAAGSDITAQREAEAALRTSHARLKALAYHDPLTGLPNRNLLLDRLQQGMALATRDRRLLGVCLLDLDGFKPINDLHGRPAGDRVLAAIAERLRQTVRASDTVGRWGGDTFALLLGGLEGRDAGAAAVRRVQEQLAQPLRTRIGRVRISASVGVTLYPEDAGDAAALFAHAEAALDRARVGGSGGIAFYTEPF